jgi:hypothetical protein
VCVLWKCESLNKQIVRAAAFFVRFVSMNFSTYAVRANGRPVLTGQKITQKPS